MSHNSNKKKYILNLFLFKTIFFVIPFSRLHIMMPLQKNIIKSMPPLQNQKKKKMMFSIHMFNLFFPNPSSNLGNKLYTTSTKPVLDTIRK